MKIRVPNNQTEEVKLERACLAVLDNLLPDAEITLYSNIRRGNKEFDGELVLKGSWGKHIFLVESKRRILNENIRSLIEKMKTRSRPDRPLLMSDFINPKTASILREEKIDFIDTAGNISLNAPPLFVWQQGFKREPPAHRPNRLFQVAGLKLLSLLLWEPDAVNGTYRDLAHRAGVSLGAIVPVFDDLTKDGFLVGTKERRQLTRQSELLEHWIWGYATQLFPRLILKTCRLAQGQTLDSLAETLRWHRLIGDILLGGELAAGLATDYLRPTRAAIHITPDTLTMWMKHLKLIPDPAGSIDLIQRFAEGNKWTEPPQELEGIQCANPILIYGELLRVGRDDRLRETADLFFEKFIARRFGAGK